MLINWKPDKSIKVSLHIQIIEYFKKKIKDGHWISNEKFPSQRSLADTLAVNRSTISLAMDELKSMGFVITNGKGGTFVSPKNWQSYSSSNMLNNLLSSGLFKRRNELFEKIENKREVIKVDFGKGELDKSLYPNLKMKGKMLNAINEINYLPYSKKNGNKELIEKIKDKMISLKINMDDNEILIVSGATQGLFITVLGLLSKENLIKTSIPCYIKSLEIFQAAGLNIKDINNKQKGIFDVYYMIPSFHNPTSLTMTLSERKQFMHKFGLNNPIIEDDVFRELWFEEEPPIPLKSYFGGENVIYISSFAKSLAPGLGIGWICASKEIINKLKEIKSQIDSGTSLINQGIVLEWLKSPDYNKNIEHIRFILKKRRDLIEKILTRDFSEDFYWEKPKGGYYYWLKSKKYKAIDIFESSLKNGLVVHPGELYGEDDSFHIRISFANCSYDKIQQGLIILKQSIDNI